MYKKIRIINKSFRFFEEYKLKLAESVNVTPPSSKKKDKSKAMQVIDVDEYDLFKVTIVFHFFLFNKKN